MALTLDEAAWPRRTERLLLRRAEPADLETTWRYRQIDDVRKYLSGGDEDFAAYTAKFGAPERMAKTLVVEREGHVIGDLMVAVDGVWTQGVAQADAPDRQAELGWCFDPAFHGRGYALEATRELLRLTLGEMGLYRVTAVCFAENEPSWRLMERLGMRRELHALKDAKHASGAWMDTLGYALLAEEWQG